MLLLDANILLYAYDTHAPHHRRVHQWLSGRIEEGAVLGLPWVSMWAFLRIATNARLQRTPPPMEVCFRALRDLVSLPGASVGEPGPQHLGILEPVSREGQATGPRMTDAVLAALAVEYGATLVSTDRDFSRFRDLRWLNPLD